MSDNDGLLDDAVRPRVVCFRVDTAHGRDVLGVCYSGHGCVLEGGRRAMACLEWNWIIVRYCSYYHLQYVLYSLILVFSIGLVIFVCCTGIGM